MQHAKEWLEILAQACVFAAGNGPITLKYTWLTGWPRDGRSQYSLFDHDRVYSSLRETLEYGFADALRRVREAVQHKATQSVQTGRLGKCAPAGHACVWSEGTHEV